MTAPDLTPDHPAVEAAERAATRWMEDRELETDLDGTAYMLTAAIPHLDAATEENLARLRGTPVGRALMAEGWVEGVLDHMGRRRGIMSSEVVSIIRERIADANPYREGVDHE